MNISSNVNFFLGLSAQLKVMHWQTKGYARHKAFDELHGELVDLTDSFAESAMGKYGRFQLDEQTKNVELHNLNENKPKTNTIEGVYEDITELTHEQLITICEERGLPTTIF